MHGSPRSKASRLNQDGLMTRRSRLLSLLVIVLA